MTPPRGFFRRLLSVAALGLMACQGDPTPTSPKEATSNVVDVGGVRLITALAGSKLQLADGGSTAIQLVRAKDGATIGDGDAKLRIPPGALSSDVVITMQALNDGFVSFQFGPNGTRFYPAATLEIRTDKANLTGLLTPVLGIAGASDDSEDWTILGGTFDPVRRVVSVPISHFSRYALCVVD